MINSALAATAGEWVYISCSCVVRTGGGIAAQIVYKCELCGNTNLRYIHTLQYDNGRQICVGVECARSLLDPSDHDIPRLAEDETKRKESWRMYYKRPGRCSTTIEDLEERGKL